MEYTEQQKADFIEQFKLKRKKQIILAILVVPILVPAIILRGQPDRQLMGVGVEVYGPIFAVAVLAAMGFSLKNWRCPACNKYLGRGINPRYCPGCGIALGPL
jgi:hypothetical protein